MGAGVVEDVQLRSGGSSMNDKEKVPQLKEVKMPLVVVQLASYLVSQAVPASCFENWSW